MMRSIGLFLTVVAVNVALAFPVLASSEEETFTLLLADLRHAAMISGTFEQQKKLPLFTQPLVSTGQFFSVRDKGLVWETDQPAPSTLMMTPGRLVQRVNGRRQEYKATGTSYDGLAILLPALLDGDIDQLEDFFDLTVTGNQKSWSLTLIPIDDSLLAMMSSVEVQGGHSDGNSVLSSLRLNGGSGDVTDIVFPLFVTDRAPGEKELAAFE